MNVTEILFAVHDTAQVAGAKALIPVAMTRCEVWVPLRHVLRRRSVPDSSHATTTSFVAFVASDRDENFNVADPHVASEPFTVTGPSADRMSPVR